ncbi:hypothetical protein ACFL19_00745 [Pseudomonadota bacterium]
MLQSSLSPTKELVDPVELDEIIKHTRYPKPSWMQNKSVYDHTWILFRVALSSAKQKNGKINTDKMTFKQLVSPGEYLTEQLWEPLLTDIRNSLLYLDVSGRITRPLRIRDVFLTATRLILHANELRQTSGDQPVRNLDHIKFEELKDYLLSFNVERQTFDSTLEIILDRWDTKKDIDWELLKRDSGLTTRAFQSVRHKLTQYLNASFENFKATKSYSREYPQANSHSFDVDIDLAPKRKSISNMISQLEALYTARPAQVYKFQHSSTSLFASGRTIFETMLEPEKTPLMPVMVSLHALSSALHFVRVYGPSLRQYFSDLNDAELGRIRELGYAQTTSRNHLKAIQTYAYINTRIPATLEPLNITSWSSEKTKYDSTSWKGGMSASMAVTLYVAAMWIILASFSAGRAASIQSLKRDCFRQSPVDGLFDLVLRIPKSSERFELEETHRPIPDLIHDYGLEFASLACELEKRRDFITDDSESFLFGAILADRSVSTFRYHGGDFYKAPLGIDSIYSSVDLFQDWSASPLINGKRWYPATHQFRRLFAVLYFNFSDQLGLEELSWFMGHANMDQTFHYAEVSPTDEWVEEAESTIARIGAQLNKTIYGDKAIQGIVKKARATSSISTVLEQLVYSMIEEHKAKTGQQVHFHKIEGENVFFYFSNSHE